MYITRKWLNKFIDLVGIENEQITIALNSLGFEVDSFKDYSKLNDKLKIAHVGNVSPIENTHLNFCFIDKGEELVSPIVCGASNVKEGQYIILAEPGKTISTGMKLEKKEIKGKISEGMICSLEEIGINVKVLSDKEKEQIYSIKSKKDLYSLIGSETALEEIGFLDAVWEIDLTLNRSDALAALQLVKEIANYFNKDISDLTKNYKHKQNELSLPVSIKCEKSIEKYVKTIASQIVLKKKILSIEQIKNEIYSNHDIWLKFNNVKTTHNFWLDLANVIAIETGQPIIFLDPKKLTAQLEIRNNKTETHQTNLQLMCENEIISTLGVDFNLDFLPTAKSEEIMIIYLSLDPIFMRKQQKEFNISSIDLQRYMKPISSRLYNLAENRVLYWLDQYNIYESNSKMEIFKEIDEKQTLIEVELEYINKLIGIELTTKEIIKLFKTLDFKVTEKNGKLHFEVDQYRRDINHSADIVEEISRIYGYDNIKSVPPVIVSNYKNKNLNLNLQYQIENFLVGLGFNNIKSYSLISNELMERWNLFNITYSIKLMSPLSKLREVYRLSLASSIIETASLNYSRGNRNLKLYEFADIYNLKNLRERHLAVLISGDILKQKSYNLDIKASYQYLKGICDEILNHYNIKDNDIKFETYENVNSDMHPFINAKIVIKNTLIGYIFKLNPRFEQSQKLDSTFILELNITKLQENMNSFIRAEEISKFQKTARDVSFILDNNQKYDEIIKSITNNVSFITNIQLIDIYQDDELKKTNSKSISVSFEFNNVLNQLTTQDVQIEWEKLLDNFKKLKIEVR
ncbi:phenylalanine--tRNA ligase subunit beta [Spiroplasma taiwanense]|uniref:Phenylalanine--tRNA ligase beta subunit n=1 Tax=Spiroplasma taiwanense CT-1 TaxID=1276220 RepID=S5LUK3_9MOLU|nr:phenylalanine--tRNA ligase subunit beta [Spiroplasma taiwanense]AGR41479.1 phenylalanyl-tRNA synthetase subunit beta [Spiroplasma taiwanense CT-1]